ncbi:PepSY domain-containing protein [Thiohalorhabdus methylotrophus]|uniref:PepSY domain-containing protein n=1 Tax=Thiohalorhabdus methylotrophus TaxID=3242694 RepID=A0ABV4TV31_9GAMM
MKTRFPPSIRGFALLGLAGLVCLLLVSLPLLADETEWRELHEQVESGELRPLSDIIGELKKRYRGQVIDVELEGGEGDRVYEIELLGADGQVVEFEVDGRNGEILGIEGTDIDDMRIEE